MKTTIPSSAGHLSNSASLSPDGRFVLLRRLGSGGFGTVYEAFDHKRNTRVALKMPHDGADAATLHRFKHEFRALADLIHPNLVTLYELHALGERCFFTMALVEGRNFLEALRHEDGAVPQVTPNYDWLSPSPSPVIAAGDPAVETVQMKLEELSAGPASPAPLPAQDPYLLLPAQRMGRLCDLLLQLVDGLRALHDAGKLHCDLKPSNVLCTPEDRLLLLDFGLAIELADGEDSRSEIMGTVGYMAPEQATGGVLSAASDWYSVGVMLYEAVAGRLPFEGGRGALLRQQLMDPPPLSSLGANVPEAFERLCLQLLQRDPAKRPQGAEIRERIERIRVGLGAATDTEQRPRQRPHRTVASPLVGRAEHLERLAAAFAETRQGHAVAVLCQGSSGMGKTRLVRHFLGQLGRHGRASPEIVVLAGVCYEQEAVPFRALDGLVDRLVRYLQRLPRLQVEALLPRDAWALQRLFPALRQVPSFAEAPERPIADVSLLRQAAFFALRELLVRLCERWPLVLFIDDLQWGDLDSVALLTEVLRAPDPPALLLVVAFRKEEREQNPVLGAFLEMLHGPSAAAVRLRELEVGELEPTAAEELVRVLSPEVIGPLQVARAHIIAREAEGNPFFITELLRHTRDWEPGPKPGGSSETARARPGVSTVDALLQGRVARLAEPARRLLEVVAVSGEPIERELVRRVAWGGEGDHGEPQAMAELRAGRLVRVQKHHEREELVSYHDRVREAVVAGLAPAWRAELHHRLALALLASKRAPPEVLALHFQQAGRLEEAARHAVRAAEAADEALAFQQASRLYRMALALGTLGAAEENRVRRRLGDTLAAARRPREAAEVYLAVAAEEPPAEALVHQRRAAELLYFGGYGAEGGAVLDRVLRGIDLVRPRTEWQTLLVLIWLRLRLLVRGHGFRERPVENIDPVLLLRIDTCWYSALALSLSDPLGSAVLQSRQVLFALDAGEPGRVARALASEGLFAAFLGERGRKKGKLLLARAAALAERIRQPQVLALIALDNGLVALMEGAWRRCEELLVQAETLVRERCTGLLYEFNTISAVLGFCRWQQGALVGLAARVPDLLQDARERGDPYSESMVLLTGEYYAQLAADRPEAAQATVERAMALCSAEGAQLQHYSESAARVRLELYRGDRGAAWRVATVEWQRLLRLGLGRFAATRIEGLFWLALAALASEESATRRERERRAAWAARRLRRERLPWADALATLLAAALAHRRGEREAALALCQAAEEGLRAVDMLLHAAAARRRRGEWQGGSEGEALRREADAWMAGQGIVCPARMAAVVAPRGGGDGSEVSPRERLSSA